MEPISEENVAKAEEFKNEANDCFKSKYLNCNLARPTKRTVIFLCKIKYNIGCSCRYLCRC